MCIFGTLYVMSRPLKYDTGPVVSISIDGRSAAWCNRIFAGDREICDMARKAARVGLTYRFRRCEVTANDSTALGAMAALASWSPGRVVIVQAPDEVHEYLATGLSHV